MDAYVDWGGDFRVDAKGGLMMIDGDTEVRQRLERRLFTAVKGYVWHPDYGAGLPQKIGTVLSVEEIRAVCAAQLALEASVALSPPAKIFVTSNNKRDTITIEIQYWDAAKGVSVSFTITS